MRDQLYASTNTLLVLLSCLALPCPSRESHHAKSDIIADLSQEIDVYSEWVDAADAVAQEAREAESSYRFKSSSRPTERRSTRIDEEDEEEDEVRYEGEGIVADDDEE